MPRPAKPTAREMLDMIVERAGQFRDAGVLEFELEGVKVKFAPPEKADPTPTPATLVQAEEASPLLDGETFGLPPGSKAPGFTRPQQDGPQWAKT